MTRSTVRWSILAVMPIVLLSLLPQIHLWANRGSQWNGAYATIDGDEFLYSAYINALLDGRPRRNDPFGARDDHPNNPLPESTFSIQLVPPFVITSLAKIFRISASTAFIVMIAAAALLSSLAAFYLFVSVGVNNRLAAIGTLFMVCFGTAAAGEGLVRLLLKRDVDAFGLLFLRRYQPSAGFFLFFVFCALIVLALRVDNPRGRRRFAALAGVVFGLLIFSYLYLWTAAATWLGCVLLIWLFARPEDRRKIIETLIVFAVFVAFFLPPYIYLLLHRARNLDETQTMIATRHIDLLRTPELIAVLILCVLCLGIARNLLELRNPSIILAASFSVLPFVLFNQQLITGRSMQPFHFEYFIVNYVSLAGLVLLGANFTRQLSSRLLLWVCVFSLLWGFAEVNLTVTGRSSSDITNDQIVPVLRHLREFSKYDGTLSGLDQEGVAKTYVFSPHLEVMRLVPTWTAQGVLAGLGSLDFGSATQKEGRVFTYLYYCGADAATITSLLKANSDDVLMSNYVRAAAFGHEAVVPYLTLENRRITEGDIEDEVRKYETYVGMFSRSEAEKYPLAYMVIRTGSAFDFSHVDRWYERKLVETVGDYDLYILKPL